MDIENLKGRVDSLNLEQQNLRNEITTLNTIVESLEEQVISGSGGTTEGISASEFEEYKTYIESKISDLDGRISETQQMVNSVGNYVDERVMSIGTLVQAVETTNSGSFVVDPLDIGKYILTLEEKETNLRFSTTFVNLGQFSDCAVFDCWHPGSSQESAKVMLCYEGEGVFIAYVRNIDMSEIEDPINSLPGLGDMTRLILRIYKIGY